MSRRNFGMTDTAFRGRTLGNIGSSISKLATAQFRLAKKDFSGDQLLQLLVPSERRQTLKDAYAIANPRGFVHDLYVELDMGEPKDANHKGILNFCWSAASVPDAFLVPNDCGASAGKPVKLLQPDCPQELVDEFLGTFNDMMDISYRFGLCNWVFSELNKVCKSPAQMRYYWPALLPLMKMAGMHDEANELAEPSPRAGSAVDINRCAAVGWLSTADSIIARAQMINVAAANNLRSPRLGYAVVRRNFLGKFEGVV